MPTPETTHIYDVKKKRLLDGFVEGKAGGKERRGKKGFFDGFGFVMGKTDCGITKKAFSDGFEKDFFDVFSSTRRAKLPRRLHFKEKMKKQSILLNYQHNLTKVLFHFFGGGGGAPSPSNNNNKRPKPVITDAAYHKNTPRAMVTMARKPRAK